MNVRTCTKNMYILYKGAARTEGNTQYCCHACAAVRNADTLSRHPTSTIIAQTGGESCTLNSSSCSLQLREYTYIQVPVDPHRRHAANPTNKTQTDFRCCCCCLKKNQTTPRPSEHPPVMGEKMSKRLGGIKRLQIQNHFMAFKQVPRCR